MIVPGIVLSRSGSLFDVLQVTCQSITIYGQTRTVQEWRDDATFHEFDEYSLFCAVREIPYITFELFHDIEYDENQLELVYKFNHNILIGSIANHSASMIYLDHWENTDETWQQLLDWKRKLQADGRLLESSRIDMHYYE